MGSKYGHLTEAERGRIQALRSQELSNRQIADRLGRNRRTIDREIKRNSICSGDYEAKRAEAFAQKRQTERSSRRWKACGAVLSEIRQRPAAGDSPELIAATPRCPPESMLSGEGIYQLTFADATAGGTMYRGLALKRPRRKRRRASGDQRGQIPNRVMIDQRAEIVAARGRIGDWEGDTIVSSGSRSALVTLVDRRSRMLLMMRLPRKSAEATAAAIIGCLRRENFVTLTLDNDKEFSNHEAINSTLKGDVYFCDPYSPWQRPSNENANRILRWRFFPKGTDFDNISDAEIEYAEHILNNRPRKILGWATPWEVYSGRAELPVSGAL